jgi:hypothetical protein
MDGEGSFLSRLRNNCLPFPSATRTPVLPSEKLFSSSGHDTRRHESRAVNEGKFLVIESNIYPMMMMMMTIMMTLNSFPRRFH